MLMSDSTDFLREPDVLKAIIVSFQWDLCARVVV